MSNHHIYREREVLRICALHRDCAEQPRVARWHRFSKVLSMVTLHSKYTRALTFENVCQAALLNSSAFFSFFSHVITS